MSKLIIEYPHGATPLDPNEINGLIPDYINTQGELNALERENILDAAKWALSGKNHDCLNASFCFDLHKRMFSKVWKWAGKTRGTDKNIGAPKEQILPKLKLLFDDTDFWIKNETYQFDEIGARFHHGLVSIHAFANGNGRHARLMTEVLQTASGETPFSWGRSDLFGSGPDVRTEYIRSLKLADKGDFSSLIQFVKS